MEHYETGRLTKSDMGEVRKRLVNEIESRFPSAQLGPENCSHPDMVATFKGPQEVGDMEIVLIEGAAMVYIGKKRPMDDYLSPHDMFPTKEEAMTWLVKSVIERISEVLNGEVFISIDLEGNMNSVQPIELLPKNHYQIGLKYFTWAGPYSFEK